MLIISRILFVVCFFLLFQSDLSAQKKAKSSSKSKASIAVADKYFNNFEFFLAVQEYSAVLEQDPTNKYVVFQMAESYRNFFHYDKSEEYYKKILDMDAKDEYPLTQFWYGVMLKLRTGSGTSSTFYR
jgi:peptidoglycan-associated lipoprotein